MQSAAKRLNNPGYQLNSMQGAIQDDMASLTIHKCRPSCTHVFHVNKAFDWGTNKQNHLVPQDRLLWKDKTCPARTWLIMSWKVLLLSAILLLVLYSAMPYLDKCQLDDLSSSGFPYYNCHTCTTKSLHLLVQL